MKETLFYDIEYKTRGAIWQYMIDHSFPEFSENGNLRILFHVRDERDFWKRVQARRDEVFIRNEKENILKAQEESRKNYCSYRYMQEISIRNNKIVSNILENGNIYKKLIYWIYKKCRKYIFN